MIIKFTQRDGYGSSIEFIERRGSDGADVDEKNNGFGPACRNSKRLVEYIGGFAAVQTFISKTTYLTSAAIGMAAIFCGVTNSPITSLLISFEMFGFAAMPFLLLAIAFSYMLSGYYGLYRSQKIMYSKFKTSYINKQTH